ncbi:MAG: glycoside hydrolase family 25 protein, partial [Prevotella sp.]|nr:glycoside hydrolase family 25 protein [Prevotella sp.]
MPPKRTIANHKTSGRRKSIVPRRRPNVFIRLLQLLPNWVWWMGGAVVVAVYIFFFYYIFVGPFGFRWRALYGDVS